MLYKLTEWETETGQWVCGCVDDLANDSNAWYLPARVLDVSPADFIRLLINKYKVNHYCFLPNSEQFLYSWDDQTAMRAFKNEINRIARAKNFQI